MVGSGHPQGHRSSRFSARKRRTGMQAQTAFPVTTLAISKNVLWLLFTTPENLKYSYCTNTYFNLIFCM